jgi:hypothetical protein
MSSSAPSPLDQRRARIRQIRTKVAAGAGALFLAVFGFLFGQLSAGGDPGLNHSTAASSTTATNPSATADASSAESDDSTQSQLPAQSSSSGQAWSSPSPAPVQTGQS